MLLFEPLALNDENVQAIYDRCLAGSETPNEDRAQSMAFLGVCGYARDVFRPVFFSKARIAQDRKNLYYLYGQLAGVHTPEDVPYALLPPGWERRVVWSNGRNHGLTKKGHICGGYLLLQLGQRMDNVVILIPN